MNCCVPDVALVEIILNLDGQDLYNITLLSEAVDTNLKLISELVKDELVVRLLCDRHQLPPKATFAEFLLKWNYWHLDREDIRYEYFTAHWRATFDVKWCLTVAARNAQRDARFLLLVDEVLLENRLLCSEEHIRIICRELTWSRELQEKYILPLRNHYTANGLNAKSCYDNHEDFFEFIVFESTQGKYRNIYNRNFQHDFLPILEKNERGEALDHEESEMALKLFDWYDFQKSKLCEVPRERKILHATLNKDNRILRSLETTMEEIVASMLTVVKYKSCVLFENPLMREKFRDIVLLNPKHDDKYTYYFELFGYENFVDHNFRAKVCEDYYIERRNYSPWEFALYVCLDRMGIDIPEETRQKLFESVCKKNRRYGIYSPEYISYFTEKLLEFNLPVSKVSLLEATRGDEEMTKWVASLEL